MMSKIRTSCLDSPANITLRVHFIDPCGRVRWELCSRFHEMRLRARVMWMWWYRWLVEKWFNNVMEFYLLRDFILVIKKVSHSKSLHVKSYISCLELDTCCFATEIFSKMRNCLKREFRDLERVLLTGPFVMAAYNDTVSNGKVVLVNEGFKQLKQKIHVYWLW